MARTLVFRVDYDHPPEPVWGALTTRESLAAWLMDNDFEPRVGHRFQLRAKPVPGWSGIVDCEVLELEPPRRMVWRWASDWIDTTVAFTLTPTATGCRVELVHDGFEGLRGHLASWAMRGWKRLLGRRLRELLRSRGDGAAGAASGGQR